jgi:hypothetical protein
MAEGGSLLEWAVSIGVVRSTPYKWAEDYPEFSDALKQAQDIGEAYWTKRLRTDLMHTKDINAPLVKLYLANRFGMSDKTEVKTDHVSSDGSMSPTRIEIVAPSDHGKG